MRVLCYPVDEWGCGKYRMIWPAECLAAAGHNVEVVGLANRSLRMYFDEQGHVVDVDIPDGTDVVVLQRPSHVWVREAVPVIRAKGIAVVVDLDDDMANIHPENMAWIQVHPDYHAEVLRQQGYPVKGAMMGNKRLVPLREMAAQRNRSNPYPHSWRNLDAACADATMVTVSTPRLLRRYAGHGRGRVLFNRLPDHMYGHEHVDSPDLIWPASIHSHPNDPPVVGNAVARLLREHPQLSFTLYGEPELDLPGPPPGKKTTAARRWNLLDTAVNYAGPIPFDEYVPTIARGGIALVPLADTTFNASKSWLKPLELCAAGVPWVASPRAEYRRIHELGAGLLADGVSEWYRRTRSLIRSDTQRKELTEAGYSVAERMRLRDHAEEWWEAWTDALAIERDRRLAGVEPATSGAR